MIDFVSQLPILMLVLPLVAAPICVVLGGRQVTYIVALIVAWCTFAISLACLIQVTQTGPIHYEIGNWEPPYGIEYVVCLLYTSPSPRDGLLSRMPSSA